MLPELLVFVPFCLCVATNTAFTCDHKDKSQYVEQEQTNYEMFSQVEIFCLSMKS